MICPICGKRKAERYCPAKGEKICAVCCGTEREVTIDCPSDCAYLIAAHRYEQRSAKPLSADQIPFPDAQLTYEMIGDLQPLIAGFAYAVLRFAAEERLLTDEDTIEGFRALAETYRTLSSGILYEKPPQPPRARGLYAALGKFIAESRQSEASQLGSRQQAMSFATAKDNDLFSALVFLLRLGMARTNGRPRSRMFLEFLRSQMPQSPVAEEAPRIIVP